MPFIKVEKTTLHQRRIGKNVNTVMMQNFIPTDSICLHTVESYLKTLGTPRNLPPESHLTLVQNARDYLYSEIAQRVPNLAPKILSADLDVDERAKALFMALSHHATDPIFIKILLNYLGTINKEGQNVSACLVTGALLAKIMSKILTDRAKPVTVTTKEVKDSKKDKDKDKKEETKEITPVQTTAVDTSDIKHLQDAVSMLLGEAANKIAIRCGNLTYQESLAIAACIASNNETTIRELIASDLPITADVLDIVQNKTELIKASLLIEKKDYPKLNQNQQKFVESLERWVFDKLEHNCTPTQAYNFLLSIYGMRPDTNKYLINVRDCGTAYSNLLQVVRLMTN